MNTYLSRVIIILILLGIVIWIFYPKNSKIVTNPIDIKYYKNMDSLDKKKISLFKDSILVIKTKDSVITKDIEKTNVKIILNKKNIKNEIEKINNIKIDSTFSIDSLHKLNSEYIKQMLFGLSLCRQKRKCCLDNA